MSPKTIIAILSLNFFSGTYMQIAVPVVSPMVTVLQLTDPVLIGLIVTLPCLTIIPANLLSGKLSETISKKTLLYIAVILYLIGGLGPILFEDITSILVCRAILGFGTGFAYPHTMGLIPDFFEEDKCATMMGVASSISSIIGSVISMMSGFLGSFSWEAAYALHSLVVIVLILIMFFLPSKPRIIQHSSRGKATFKPIVYFYAAISLIIFMSIMVVFTKISIFIDSEKLGTVTSTGIASGSITFFAFVGSIIFGKIFKATKQYTSILPLGCMAVGFLLLAWAYNFAMVLIALAFFGFGLGLFVPFMMTKTTIVSQQNASFALSIVIAGIFAGQFLSAFFIQLISTVSGDPSARFTFLANGVFLIIATGIALVTALKTARNADLPQHQ